ncbi:MAG: DUF2147 domain-containing protein [Erythrobacter sp.]|uniref:DUF2147 domain-containing protein n=1 Tax=Erythrobacter sp. TaxID=1042 RepID=UPI0026361A34|nr:DUF2147 domain-containing protein [Erythrobacter sp.]MDJ0978249.1 DUF2147 domain-containing protein [Erythrobacter sp.]
MTARKPHNRFALLGAFAGVLAGGGAATHAAEPIAGRWVTEEGDAIITISPCGPTVCGRISQFLVPPPDGADQRDIYDPDPAKQKRRLMGLPILTGFAEEETLWRGRIYDPKSGRSYRSVVRRKGANAIEVKGCISFFCQTQIWKKAS